MEAALAPFPQRRQPVGAAWIRDRHDQHFDAEDLRMLRVLADFAGACWVQWKNWDAAIAENRRRDEIFTTLIHELRSPLAAITAAACVIEQTAGLTAAGGQPAIDVVKRQSRVLSRIVDDLTDLARIGRDKLDGSLRAASAGPGKGAEFTVSLPRHTSLHGSAR
jgi:signal transduction histidine kinase